MFPETDRIRLQHMLEATRDALAFAKDRTRDDLSNDRMLYRALVNCVGEVGEAASKIDPQTKRQLPDVPWAQINGMRNRLIHAYFDVDHDVLWRTVTAALPQLQPALLSALGLSGDRG